MFVGLAAGGAGGVLLGDFFRQHYVPSARRWYVDSYQREVRGVPLVFIRASV
ncbi:hypothetical protein [uncultured Nitrosomonas sp.]|uniref:hypothetical protein n=1 Tax=uncultured Nitrosomonas sp. TaxID=156424 RepID=UPI0026281F7D|nr:hypothetical protein [uncultured Nitrosomonas sp.]